LSRFREGLIFILTYELTKNLSDLILVIGLGLIVGGLIIAFTAIVLSQKKSNSQVKGGGIILIGPVPIIFGTDRDSVKVLVLLAIVLIGIVSVFMLLAFWLR